MGISAPKRRRLGWTLAAVSLALLIASAWPRPAEPPEPFAPSARRETAVIRPIPPAVGAVRVNTADAPALKALPGIGDALARAILEERDAHGAFFYPEDLLAARGIGEKRLAALRGWLDLTCEADRP